MDSFAPTQHLQRKLFPTPVPIPSGPVLISQQALCVPTAVSGQCGKLCAAVEATCPHLQMGGGEWKATELTPTLPRPRTESHCVG